MGRKVDVDDLIDAHDVAELLGLTRSTSVSVYQARYEDMPRPVIKIRSGHCMLWLRSEITAWAQRTGRIKRP